MWSEQVHAGGTQCVLSRVAFSTNPVGMTFGDTPWREVHLGLSRPRTHGYQANVQLLRRETAREDGRSETLAICWRQPWPNLDPERNGIGPDPASGASKLPHQTDSSSKTAQRRAGVYPSCRESGGETCRSLRCGRKHSIRCRVQKLRATAELPRRIPDLVISTRPVDIATQRSLTTSNW